MTAKKRNKRYNPEARQRQVIAASLKQYLVTYFVNTKQAANDIGLVNFEGTSIPVTPKLAHVIETHKHKWSIMLGVFYMEKGAANCSMRLVDVNQHCKQSELVTTLNKEHQDFIKSKQDINVDVLGAGWIASPVGVDLEEDLCGNIFDKLGALDL